MKAHHWKGLRLGLHLLRNVELELEAKVVDVLAISAKARFQMREMR